MRNFKKVLIVCFLFLSTGCTFSGKLWESKSYQESFKNYFIDEEGNRVVLIGENYYLPKKQEKYHYFLDDSVEDVVKMYESNYKYRYIREGLNCPQKFGNVKKIFELGSKTKGISVSLDYPQETGDKIFTRTMGIVFDKKKLSEDEIKFLHNNNFADSEDGESIYQNCPMKMIRYTSSEESTKNYQLIPLGFEKDGKIWNRNTPLQTIRKVVLTPFAVVGDLLLTPITVPYFFYSLIKESKTEYQCQGNFCDYNKLENTKVDQKDKI